MTETRRVYKALKHGKSPYQHFEWPVPKGKKPGRWLSIDEQPVLCQRGFHGYHRLEDAERDGSEVYEMEVAGKIVEDSTKLAAQRARLVRRIWQFEPQGPIERGILPCRRCGEAHDSYVIERDLAPQWGSLVDGHSYDPVSWEDAARGLEPAVLVDLANKLRGEAQKGYKGSGTYSPVVPAYHAFKEGERGRCGTCGLGKALHEGWEARATVADEFRHADRWDLLAVIQQLRAS
jgi:hypothetical protein